MSKQVTPAQFKVLMNEFDDAIGVVAKQSEAVHEALVGIEQDFTQANDLWGSPASGTFGPLRSEFKRDADELDDVLAGILHRMRITYGNYLDAERRNAQNLTAHEPPGPGGNGPGGKGPGGNGSGHTGGDHRHKPAARPEKQGPILGGGGAPTAAETAARDGIAAIPRVAAPADEAATAGTPILPVVPRTHQ